MSALSSKISKEEEGYGHWCPACREVHTFRERTPFEQRPTWTYDHNHEHPSFDPSMNISHPEDASDPTDVIPAFRCHYRLISGYIHYCTDCTHSYSGMVIPLPDLPAFLQGPVVTT